MGFKFALCVFSVCAALLQTWNVEAAGDELALSKDGKTEYTIKVSPDDPVANTAAKELAQHLKLVTGAEFPIVKTEGGNPSFVIAVGPAAAKTLMPDLDLSFAKLGNDGIVMKSAGANLVLTGAEGAKRGTIYAVYDFLENKVGVRWWTSKESFIPKKPSLAVTAMDTVYVPPLFYRDSFYIDMFNGVFAARSKNNGHWSGIPAEYGGRCRILGFCHTFYQLLPPSKYFKDHPDWYSEKAGKRTAEDGSQLCLVNDEMRAELTKNALEWLRKNPDAGMISISQNDGCRVKNGCECPQCAAVVKEEGAPSGLNIRFVNKVAEDIEKEFPNVYVKAIAYDYTQKPPLKARPRQNVILQFCVSPSSFSNPISESKEKVARLQAWSSISPQLLLWGYVANFKNFLEPYPNLYTTAPDIRFFIDNKARGIMEEGDNGSVCGDFVQLRAWLIAHLLWNPGLDDKALIKEFMDGYYGAASQPLKEYLELVHNAAKGDIAEVSLWFKLDDMIRANALFDKAAALVASDPALSRRVRRARMPLDYTWIVKYDILKFKAKGAGEKFQGPSVQEMAALCDRFLASAKEFDLRKYSEHNKFENIAPAIASRFHSPVPKEVAGLPDGDWFEVQVGDFGLWEVGKWADVVVDPKASLKRAVRMPGNHSQWATYYNIPPSLGPLRCYAVVRAEAKAGGQKQGNAFKGGIYDGKNAKPSASETVANADGEYRTYDLGVCDVKPGEKAKTYAWIGPCANPDDVDAVYVDRMFFVREQR